VRQIALLVFALGITGLFLLERDPKKRPSKALLLPLAWLLIAGSRNVGEWLQMGGPSEGGDAYLDGNPLDRNLLAIFIAIGVVILIQRRRKVGVLLRANAPILLYFAYCLVSLLWSDFPFVGFKRWIRALGDVAMVLIVLTDRDWLLARKRLFAWAAFLLLPISVLLIRYYSELGRTYSIFDGQVYWTGVTTNKNELGMICMIFGLASLSRVLDVFRGREGTGKMKVLAAHGVIVVTAIWLIHMANSATALACFMIGSCLLLFTTLPLMRRPVLVHVLVAALLGVAVSALFLGVGTGMVQDLGRNSTLTGRTDMWRHALQLVENPMVGAGYESFWVGPRLEKMRPVAPGVNQAHNGYLEVYLNLGWVGVTMLAIVIVTGYRNVIAAYRRDPDPARLRLAYFVVALSYAFTESAFKFRHPVWISFLIAIMAIPIMPPRRIQKSKAATTPDRDPIEVESAEVTVYEERI
jgi:O-antigen ligase